MTLTEYIDKAHTNATKKGFHKGFKDLLDSIIMHPILEDKNKAKLLKYIIRVEMIKDLGLLTSEIGEAVEFARTQKNIVEVPDKENWKESIEEEVADIFIRLCDFCGKHDIDLEYYVNKKMEYNKTRPNMHGKSI